MTALADAFRGTGARTVLCVLDCCISGQAPARVFETDARPRNAFAVDGIAGEGRILLAACKTSESAWEQPGTCYEGELALPRGLEPLSPP